MKMYKFGDSFFKLNSISFISGIDHGVDNNLFFKILIDGQIIQHNSATSIEEFEKVHQALVDAINNSES